MSGGYVGVDVFFVISGFLITTHLLQSLEREGVIGFGSFYAKRMRRILPAALFVAATTVIAAWVWMPPLLMEQVMLDAVAVALYAPNILFAFQGTDYLGETAPSVFQHYWSLGIEEQFYLFWPALLVLGFWLFKRNERALFRLVMVLAVASLVLCLVAMGISQPWAFFSPMTRGWELGVGGLVAFLLRSGAGWLARPQTGLLSWVGLAALVLISVGYDSSTPYPSFYALGPVLATAFIIIGGGSSRGTSTDKILSLRFLQFVGKISYSLYLVHWPLQVIPQAFVGLNSPLPLWTRLLLGLVAFPLAWLLFTYIEEPAMRYRPLSEGRPRRTLWVAAAASALVIVTAGGAGFASSRVDLYTKQLVQPVTIAVQPAGTDFVPQNLSPSLRDSSDDNPDVYASGCHLDVDSTDASGCQIGGNIEAPLVFLFGDSHAASWFPALAELAKQGTIRLDSNTKSSCPSADVPSTLDGTIYGECLDWRADVIARINTENPDLVVLANYSALAGEDTASIEIWAEGLRSTITSMPERDVSVIADVPDHGSTPAICLSSNLEDAASCDVPKSTALRSDVAAAERNAVISAGATYTDLTEYLCAEGVCPAIIGHQLAYRDAHHLTATFSRQLSRPLWDALSEVG